MSTPLTDSIDALTTYANEVTGQSDTTLSDAVHTLASGYGGGSPFKKIDSYTVETEIDDCLQMSQFVKSYSAEAGHTLLFFITGNTYAENQTDYAGLSGIMQINKNTSVKTMAFIRNMNLSNSESAAYEFHVSVGSVIDIYDITP